jgi:hypothetical protein
MPTRQFVRVVALRKGKLKSAEFRLRPGERGLSLFELSAGVSAVDIVEAVKSLGKQGDLAAAMLTADAIRSLGLTIAHTWGGTASPEINTVHAEARLALWRRLLLFLRGVRPYDYFNDQLSPRLCALAQIIE